MENDSIDIANIIGNAVRAVGAISGELVYFFCSFFIIFYLY